MAAFIMNRGLFKPLMMYFSMCNAPATFRRMMDVCFQKVLMSRCVFVYVNDVLITGDDLEEVRYWMREVLTVMRINRLSCKPVKCQFEQRSIVTASVTKEIKEGTKPTSPTSYKPNRNELSKDEPDQPETIRRLSQAEVTHRNVRERDSGMAPVSHDERATLTGKLCKRVMALIRWQCSTDTAVDDHMVRVLEGWLRKRGISIYTDLL
jgi:hypothetical protein